MNAYRLISRDRELYELWGAAILVPVLLSAHKVSFSLFLMSILIQGSLVTFLLSQAAQGRAWGRGVFGVLMASNAVVATMVMVSSGASVTERVTAVAGASMTGVLSARAFRVV